ncbi:ligase-associated DNA damage response endonuclease PdeM [Erythrobacter sp. LQ02-29]|uniref:ligase-associated DNA damage response endonuclease PdeM n=1 Tax=Erythrobacter sp. LQ02-29 TaxID=2920384 RepID=UPI001F4F0E04|nr:ligase-associated DNA damage response endonuclease PdeM [Erythrobacter sp. LQ02-29]MCP9222189.1 ligase-associated DNA damage response endonuclease PdeM [Erythrobacter sp. LQ02-29]
MVPLSFAGEEMALTRAGALFWPRMDTLFVADLHLEKASFFARTGQFLPPYDSRETLSRVTAEIAATGARRVITLGDNFHDPDGATRLEDGACAMLEELTGRVEWIWITGNHDVGKDGFVAEARCGGALAAEMELGGVALRHEAHAGAAGPELSGHFHPKLQMRVHGRRINRPCAVIGRGADGADRMVLPAFGTFTGGMSAADPAVLRALRPAHRIEAVVPARDRAVTIPLWQAGDSRAA